MRAPRIALAGGGSGGHLFPGLAVAGRLLGPGERPVLYGSGKAAESGWLGGRASTVAMDAPLMPRARGEVPRFVMRLSGAVRSSVLEMRRRRPDLVVGLGGYASVAPGIAALISGRPLLLLEQNAVPGKANRLLARMGGWVAVSWSESVGHLPRSARGRVRVLGNPLRGDVLRGAAAAERFGLQTDHPILLVMGGSQGAQGLNARVLEAAPALARRGVQVLHLTGEAEEERAREVYREHGVRAWVRAFSSDMGVLYRTADLLLCRAGGTTLAEAAALGRPCVLVPYPHHSDRHQERNAGIFVRAGAARSVPEDELAAERFEREVLDLIEDREELSRMGRAAAGLGVPDAADRVAGFARELMRR